MSEPAAPLLAVDQLATVFRTGGGAVHAVNGISFRLNAGELVAIVGESGSGKSVSMMSLVRLIPGRSSAETRGAVMFGGRDLTKLRADEIRRVRGKDIGIVFQDPMTSLNPVLTIGFQIMEPLRKHLGLSKARAGARAIELLGLVGIPSPAQRFASYPYQFSGGMRQRVVIAIALACAPQLLIADEPTTALDVTVQAQILDLVKRLRRERGMGILWVTHDLGVAAGIADRIIVMYGGAIVEQAPVSALFAHPRHPYTRALLESLPSRHLPHERLRSIAGQPPLLRAPPSACSFAPRCQHAFERCWRENPVLETIGADHQVACWWDGQGDTLAAAAPKTRVVATSAPEILLDVDDLRLHFPITKGLLRRAAGAVRAVDGLTFQIRRGETLALVGESGCGKSTTGRALLRLYAPTGGRISFRGQDITALGGEALRRLRPRMQMIFQDPQASLNPRMTVGAIIDEPLREHAVLPAPSRRARVAELLDLVGLDPTHADRYPHEFSGGQRQRIGIARALALEPDFIVCDEPIAALDVSIQAQIINLLEDLQARLHLTYLFISHDLGMVRHIADRVAVMYLGKMMELAPAGDLFARPLHPYTQALLSAVPVADPLVESTRQRTILTGDIPEPSNPPPGCRFCTRCPAATPECFSAEPIWREMAPGHHVACHHAVLAPPSAVPVDPFTLQHQEEFR